MKLCYITVISRHIYSWCWNYFSTINVSKNYRIISHPQIWAMKFAIRICCQPPPNPGVPKPEFKRLHPGLWVFFLALVLIPVIPLHIAVGHWHTKGIVTNLNSYYFKKTKPYLGGYFSNILATTS